MPAYLITFKPDTENPGRGWPLSSLQKLVTRLQRYGQVEEPWRFAARKAVSLGDPIFLLLQGKLGPAIIGTGIVSGVPTKDKPADILFDCLVDPTRGSLISRERLLSIRTSQSLWRTQASGIRIPESIAIELEELTQRTASKGDVGIREEELIDDQTYLEGRVRQVTMTLAERNPQARKDAVRKHGIVCIVCGFDFERVFGPLGKGFIHFHHIHPIGNRGRNSRTYIDELVPVCPNCHSMLHRKETPLSISELKKILAAQHNEH